ncbi:MAG TPA: hypothetical protein VNR39_17890 [Pseudolabrys sp.]|nr:hypothetical protein [Pseudolabrys sp.]
MPTSIASIWWVPLGAALIGAIAALMTPFVTQLYINRVSERHSRSQSQREIFRNYAAPLAATCEKLIWRFSEIFIDNRHHFLKMATRPLIFNEYKRKSTLYRIASLLGWVRAINLELSALPRGEAGFISPISKAIRKVQSALADGPHVELHRLEQMCSVWRLSLSSLSEEHRRALANRFEVKLYSLAGDSLKYDSDHLKVLDDNHKRQICSELALYLCSELKRAPISDAVVAETVNQAISALSYREALIYRDWQDAIGDAMLEIDSESVRRFKIIGYEKFEGLLDGEALWMKVFRSSINDIDFDSVDPNDFRAKQLKDLSIGVAEIIKSFDSTKERDLLDRAAVEMARKIAPESAAVQ